MENQEIFDRLKAIAQMPGANADPVVCCDRIDPLNLLALQSAVAELLLDLAHSFPTEEQELTLVSEMPYAFNDLKPEESEVE